MTWPNPKDRIIVSGHVDDRGETHAWIVIDDATGISATGTPLLRIPIDKLVPELPPHVLLADLWRTGESREQVMLLGKLVKETEGGLVQVEFTNTFPTEPLRLTIDRSSVIFGRSKDDR